MERRKIPFGKEDQEMIASASIWGMAVAAISIGSTVVEVALNVIRSRATILFTLAAASVYLPIVLILGIWLFQASRAFYSVGSEGADERQLLEGLRKLRNYFKLTGIIIIVLVAIGGFLVLSLLVCRMSLRF